jgi:hypothetical protein
VIKIDSLRFDSVSVAGDIAADPAILNNLIISRLPHAHVLHGCLLRCNIKEFKELGATF